MRRVAVNGASGRMGQRVVRILRAQPSPLDVVEVDKGSTSQFGGCDVVIDFSLPSATKMLVLALEDHPAALVTGVTGRSQEEQALIDGLCHTRPVLQAANFSLGVHVLGHVVGLAARLLSKSYQVEIAETHHQHKRDLPSGTALFLAEAAATARGDTFAEVYADRARQSSRQTPSEIGVSGMRGGTVIGDHSVHFLGELECLEFSHSATDRDVFAQGAVEAAKWLCGQPSGPYTMGDFVSAQIAGLNA